MFVFAFTPCGKNETKVRSEIRAILWKMSKNKKTAENDRFNYEGRQIMMFALYGDDISPTCDVIGKLTN